MGSFYVLFCQQWQKSTKRTPPKGWAPSGHLFSLYGSVWQRIYTAGDSKSAPQTSAETLFSRPAKLNPRQMRGHSCGCRKFAPQGKICYPSNALPAGREKGRVPRGRRSAVRAGIRVLATFRAIRLFRHLRKSRAVQDDGYLRKKPWVSSLGGALLVLFSRHREKST